MVLLATLPSSTSMFATQLPVQAEATKSYYTHRCLRAQPLLLFLAVPHIYIIRPLNDRSFKRADSKTTPSLESTNCPSIVTYYTASCIMSMTPHARFKIKFDTTLCVIPHKGCPMHGSSILHLHIIAAASSAVFLFQLPQVGMGTPLVEDGNFPQHFFQPHCRLISLLLQLNEVPPTLHRRRKKLACVSICFPLLRCKVYNTASADMCPWFPKQALKVVASIAVAAYLSLKQPEEQIFQVVFLHAGASLKLSFLKSFPC